ncbi:MAG TPA: hypothetical protein VEC14_05445 [Reyranellaceae bacterium]|nr:hypothetical protein [Reyranellaceae bacterium]
MLRLLLSAVAAAAAMAGAAQAQTQSPYQIAASWGLLGSWLFDCAAPYSNNNALYTYVWRNNQVMLDRDYGDNRRDSNTVTALRSGKPDQIEYVVIFGSVAEPQSRQHIWQKDPSGRRMRLLLNRNPLTGQTFVANGQFEDDGTPTAWNYRCR